MAETINIISAPDNIERGSGDIVARITTEEKEDAIGGGIADVKGTTTLLINGSEINTKTGTNVSGTTFEASFTYAFPEAGEYDIIFRVNIDYGGSNDETFGQDEIIIQDSRTVTIRETPTQPTALTGNGGYVDSFKGRSDTILENITTDSGENLTFELIDFSPYGNPSISVDTSARFAVHDILGGTTVRQKIGEKPREVQIDGVCTETVARQVNQLNKAKLVSLNSDVIGDIIRCQVASTSTDPLDDGGAANMDNGEFLYDFSISLVEVGRPQNNNSTINNSDDDGISIGDFGLTR